MYPKVTNSSAKGDLRDYVWLPRTRKGVGNHLCCLGLTSVQGILSTVSGSG